MLQKLTDTETTCITSFVEAQVRARPWLASYYEVNPMKLYYILGPEEYRKFYDKDKS